MASGSILCRRRSRWRFEPLRQARVFSRHLSAQGAISLLLRDWNAACLVVATGPRTSPEFHMPHSHWPIYARTPTFRNVLLSVFAAFNLLASSVATVHGQSALDGFDPNANGQIRVIVVQPDGKILIGGDFTTVAPNGGPVVTRNRIARLNPDGSLDAAFNPNADSGAV